MKKALLALILSLPIFTYSQLNGAYTIGGNSPVFTSIQHACDSLKQVGVAGPVVFNIRDGIYFEADTLYSVAGVSSQNTITFQSENHDSSLVHIVSQAGVTFYSSADYLRFYDLTIYNDSVGHVTKFDSITSLIIDHCTLYTDSISGAPALYLNSPDTNISQVNIANSTIVGGTMSFYLVGGDSIENISIHNSVLKSNSLVFYLNSNSAWYKNISLNNSMFDSKTAPVIYITNAKSLSEIFMDSCVITTLNAPGIYFPVVDSFDNVNIRNCNIINNNAPGFILYGGNHDSRTLNIADNNFISTGGPTIIINPISHIVIDSINILRNHLVQTSTSPVIIGNNFSGSQMNISGNVIPAGGGGINLYSNGGHNKGWIISNNDIKISTPSMGIYLSADTLSDMIISNNHMDTIAGNGIYNNGININANHNYNMEIDSNNISNFTYSAVQIYSPLSNATFNGNKIYSQLSGSNGIMLNNIEDSTVKFINNQFYVKNGNAINIYSNATSTNNAIEITNNFMSGCAPCLYLNLNMPVKIDHNSINTNLISGSPYVLSFYAPAGTGDYSITNNIINVDSALGSYSVYNTPSINYFSKLRNNVYKIDTIQSYLLNAYPNYHSIYNLNSATGLDSGSFYANVSFVNDTADLHVNCTETYLNAAYPTNDTVDIDGTPRSYVSTIGADELISDNNLLMVNSAEICGNTLTFTPEYIPNATFLWNTGDTTAAINISTAGAYILSANTSCGVLTDTINVNYATITNASASVVQVGLSSQFSNTSTNANSYLWNFGDGDTSTSIEPTHIYASVDTFIVTLIAYGDCVNDTLQMQVFPNDVSVKTIGDGDYSFNMYPNPADDVFRVSMKGLKNNNISISVISLQGRVLTSIYNEGVSGDYVLPINIAALEAGVYIIRVAVDDTMFSSRIFKK